MNLEDQSAIAYHREKLLYALTAIVVAGILALIAIMDVYKSRQNLSEANHLQSEATGFLLSEWIAGSFREIEHATMTLAAKSDPSDFVLNQIDDAKNDRISAFLKQQAAHFSRILSLGYMTPECDTTIILNIAKDYQFPVGTSFKDEDFCRGIVDFPDKNEHHSRIYQGSTSTEAMAYVRRVFDDEGSFIGLAGVSFTMTFFQQWLERIKTDPYSSVAIINLEGHRLALNASSTPAQGEEITKETYRDLIKSSAGADKFDAHFSVSGDDIHAYFHRVPELPFFTVVVSKEKGLLAPLRSKAIGYFVGLMLIYLLTTVLLRKHFKMIGQSIQLRDQAIRLQHGSEEKSRFLAMLGRELKTPLSVIRTVLANRNLTPALKNTAVKSIKEMDDIISASQAVEKIESGNVSVTLSPCYPGGILHDIVGRKGGNTDVAITADRQVSVETDGVLLRVVFSNLLDNARKYGAPGSQIEIDLQAASEPDWIILTIANHVGSSGLPDPSRIFQKYYRAPAAHRISGSGLGLYLVEGFVRILGGAITYEPDGDCAVFRVYIPSSRPPPSA